MVRFRIGQRIKNIHSDNEYTITDVELVKIGASMTKTVYVCANDNFESHRFNEDYVKHYNTVKASELQRKISKDKANLQGLGEEE